MNKVDLYIDNTRADAFNDESISLELSTQNIKDIGKVFGEFSQTFSLPATKTNNGIFKHYYNVDIVGGFDANVRIDAIIEVNTIIFREGSIELEGLQFKNGEPYAYNVTFYGKTASLKDEFGEDQLTDLDLSAYDHTYSVANIENGLANYVSGTGSTIIYPLISSSHNWYYNSASSDEEIDNIHYHSGGGGHIHGVQYYDLKPAIKVKAILDAIEADYGITFNSNFFDTADFSKLFMWCHRKEGYMFKGQRDSYPSKLIDFQSGTNFDLTKDSYTVNSTIAADGRMTIEYIVNFISGSECELQTYVNGEKRVVTPINGSSAGFIFVPDLKLGDLISFYFAPKSDWGGGLTQISVSVTGKQFIAPFGTEFTASTGGLLQTYSTELVVADQMPEQKIIDFLSGLVKMFNLVVTYEGGNTYKIEPLDDWYADGTTHDFTRYIDTTEYSANRADLYRRISFKYQETEALFGERYRNTSGGGVGYGDLRADFTYDGSDFEVENTFENMLFEKLSDQNTGLETNIMVGKSIDKDLEPYIGSPYIFYVPQRVSLTDSIALVNGGSTEITDVWLVSNCNAVAAGDITQTLNYGSELDPLTQQVQTGGLYETYWQDYITDLYSTSRRVYRFSAIVPLNIMLQLKTNDKLKIVDRYYIINNVSLDLTTGQATLELLNDV